MANLIFDKAQIEATIDKIVDRTMRMDMTWDWPCGVAYYGICEAYEVTKTSATCSWSRTAWTSISSWACRAGRSTPAQWGTA